MNLSAKRWIVNVIENMLKFGSKGTRFSIQKNKGNQNKLKIRNVDFWNELCSAKFIKKCSNSWNKD